ncbi:MAG TPA: hypothetical protein VF679_12250 [Pedobacter sp.]
MTKSVSQYTFSREIYLDLLTTKKKQKQSKKNKKGRKNLSSPKKVLQKAVKTIAGFEA